jgi:hypothetical protein
MNWTEGNGPENHVLLRTGGDLRVPLYASPVSPPLPGEIERLRHECAGSGMHDHDGCSCTDDELRARTQPAPEISEEMVEAKPLVLSKEMLATIEAERLEFAAEVAATWRDALSHKDWLFDGSPIKGPVMLARFSNLDWEKAYVDLGPSIAGNLGPYWHVPLKETIIDGELYDAGDTVHRLYPKVLQSKWALLILHACNEVRRCALPKTRENADG